MPVPCLLAQPAITQPIGQKDSNSRPSSAWIALQLACHKAPPSGLLMMRLVEPFQLAAKHNEEGFLTCSILGNGAWVIEQKELDGLTLTRITIPQCRSSLLHFLFECRTLLLNLQARVFMKVAGPEHCAWVDGSGGWGVKLTAFS
jgi:hypothetical protein